jgi:hypothetical protein
MCKELPVILVNKVVDPKRIIGKKWRAEEEERHKGLLTPTKKSIFVFKTRQATHSVVNFYKRQRCNSRLALGKINRRKLQRR